VKFVTNFHIIVELSEDFVHQCLLLTRKEHQPTTGDTGNNSKSLFRRIS